MILAHSILDSMKDPRRSHAKSHLEYRIQGGLCVLFRALESAGYFTSSKR